MRISENTKTHKLFTALQAGEKVSPSQAEKRFGIKNISAEVSRIRQSGFAVYANRRMAAKPCRSYRIPYWQAQPQDRGCWLQGYGPGTCIIPLGRC